MILCTLLLVILSVPVAAADAPVKSLLEQIETGRLDLTPLAVSYDDLHPLHGGLVLTIHGTGKVEQRAVRQTPGRPKLVPREDLLKLVHLLLREQAWEQRVPERAPRSDESTARLTIRYRNDVPPVGRQAPSCASLRLDQIATLVEHDRSYRAQGDSELIAGMLPLTTPNQRSLLD